MCKDIPVRGLQHLVSTPMLLKPENGREREKEREERGGRERKREREREREMS